MNISTVPSALNNVSISPMIKSYSESEIKIVIILKEENFKNNVIMNEEKITPNSQILIKKFVYIKNFLHLKALFSKLLIMNLFSFTFIILLIYIQIYINQYIDCDLDNSNIIIVAYVIFRKLIENFYYILYNQYVIFSFIDNSSNFMTIMITLNTLFFLFLKIYHINPLIDYFDMYISDMFLGFFIAAIYYYRFFTSWKEVKNKIIIIISLIVFTLLIHQFSMKNYVIPKVRELTLDFEQGKIIFQVFLYFYFKIYGKILFKGLVKCVEYCQPQKCDECIMIVAKFYLLDAISSCLPATITEPFDSKEFWLGIINFLYHTFVLYDPENNLFEVVKRLFYKVFIKKIITKKWKNKELKVKNIISHSVKEILIIVFLQGFMMACFKKVLVGGYYSYITKNCKLEIVDWIDVKLENVFVLLTFLILLMIALILRKGTTTLPDWNIKHSSILFNIYLIILQHFLCDFNAQFYLHLYYLKKY